MSDRYTRKDAEVAFDRLCDATGHRKAQAYNDIGGWTLDYASVYGGYVVESPINDGGGITHPLGETRRTAREFVDVVRFALRVLEVAS